MAQRGRPGLSAQQKRDLWSRWKAGQSLSEIARALAKNPGSIHGVLSANGGIVPRERCRREQHLTLHEREEVSRGVAAGRSIRAIAAQLGRPASTVSRELARNGGRACYRATRADERACDWARRPKTCMLAANAPLAQLVADKLAKDWSPQQISGWLRAEFAGNNAMRVSHETIYRSLFIQARGVLKKELVAHLRSRRVMRRAKTAQSQPRGQIVEAVSIRERPAEAEDRAVPGH